MYAIATCTCTSHGFKATIHREAPCYYLIHHFQWLYIGTQETLAVDHTQSPEVRILNITGARTQ